MRRFMLKETIELAAKQGFTKDRILMSAAMITITVLCTGIGIHCSRPMPI